MDLAPRFNLVDWLLFIAVLVVAGGLRGGYLALALDRGAGPTPLLVQGGPKREDARRQGQETAVPDGFQATSVAAVDEPTTLFYRLFGLARDRGIAADALFRWIQLGLGTLTAGLYFLFARRGFGSRVVGAVAGLFCALHPLWIFNTAEINDGVICCFLVALVLWLAARGARAGGIAVSLILGLALASLPLFRWTMIPFAIGCLAWYIGRCCMVRRGWLWLLAALVGFSAAMAGGFAADGHLAGSWLDQGAMQLWQGNHPEATGTPASDRDPVATDPDLARLSSIQRDRQLLRSTWNWARTHPFEAVQARARAATAFFFGGETFSSQRLVKLGVEDEPPVISGMTLAPDRLAVPLLLTFLVLYLLVVMGWRWTFAWRRMSRPGTLALLLIPLAYLLGQAGTLHGPRLPLDGVLLCLAAFALVCAIPIVRRRLVAGEFI